MPSIRNMLYQLCTAPGTRIRALALSLFLLAFAASSLQGAPDATAEIKVLAWNIWGKLNQASKYDFQGKSARTRMIEILKDSQADVICMIETYGSAADIAKSLGYHYYTPGATANLTIFSRYTLSDVGGLEGLSPFSHIKATAHLSEKLKVKIHCIWLSSGGRHIVAIKNERGMESRQRVSHSQWKLALLRCVFTVPSDTADMSTLVTESVVPTVTIVGNGDRDQHPAVGLKYRCWPV